MVILHFIEPEVTILNESVELVVTYCELGYVLTLFSRRLTEAA